MLPADELIPEGAGAVIFKNASLELMAFWQIPVICPAKEEHSLKITGKR